MNCRGCGLEFSVPGPIDSPADIRMWHEQATHEADCLASRLDNTLGSLEIAGKRIAQLEVDVKMHSENTDRQHDRALDYMRERDAAVSRLHTATEALRTIALGNSYDETATAEEALRTIQPSAVEIRTPVAEHDTYFESCGAGQGGIIRCYNCDLHACSPPWTFDSLKADASMAKCPRV